MNAIPEHCRIPGVSLHARQRFAERFGREAAREAWLAAVLDIIDGRAAVLAGFPDDRRVHLVRIGPITARVLWCSRSGQIITVFADEQHHLGKRHEGNIVRARHTKRYARTSAAFARAEGPRAEEWHDA